MVTSHITDFPHLLKACAYLSLLPLGRILHQRIIIVGLASNPYLATSLLHMYAMNRRIYEARQVFDQMPVRNVVPYSAIISAYCRSANVNMALSVYNMMLNEGIRPNSVTLLGLLSGISELEHVECLHALLVQLGFEDDLVIANSMINVYSSCEKVDLARIIFDSMPLKDCISWNSMVAGYSRSGTATYSLGLFHKMRDERFFPDHQTYGALLASLTNNSRCYGQCGSHIHALVITSGFGSDSYLVTTLVSMYLKFSNLDYAFMLFDRCLDKDVVLWTAMISGLVKNDRADEALFIFHQMVRSSRLILSYETVASALAACAHLGQLRIGASIHGFVLRQRLPLDNAAENSLITLYAKCDRLRQCRNVFDSMQVPDLVSWNAVVSGFARNARLDEAFQFFAEMISATQRPDMITVVSLLQGCAAVGELEKGKLVHNFMIRHEVNSGPSMETSLVDMYSKCGRIESAQKCFERMLERDVVSWSVIISGYANHGMGEAALRMYSEFLRSEMDPNNVLFLAVLSACSHSGLVSEGLGIFNSMIEEFRMEPRIEHCGCVVDLLCRSGNVEEGLRFFRAVSTMENADVLGIILDACRANDCADLAEEVVKEMVELKQGSAGNYVRLAKNYASMNKWDGVGETLRRMKEFGLKKTPGWSFVESKGSKYTFFADGASHPQWDEIIWLLDVLRNEMKDIDDGQLQL